MNVELIKLKIKAKSLAEEARIIRKEERKLRKIPFHKRSEVHKGRWYSWTTCYLSNIKVHRTWNVRNEARATQLAIAYIKEKPYSKVEHTCKDIVKRDHTIGKRVLAMVQKYGNKKTTKEQILDWMHK